MLENQSPLQHDKYTTVKILYTAFPDSSTKTHSHAWFHIIQPREKTVYRNDPVNAEHQNIQSPILTGVKFSDSDPAPVHNFQSGTGSVSETPSNLGILLLLKSQYYLAYLTKEIYQDNADTC